MRLFKLARKEPVRALDLSWIDEFIDNVRPYVFVREEDRILIKRPNQAQTLNEQGARILKSLLDGKRIGQLLDEVGRGMVKDIQRFLFEIQRFLDGTVDESSHGPGVEVRPLDMCFSELPILSEVAITYRCNLMCSFCYAGCNCTTNPVGSDREMSVAEIRELLRKIFEEAKVPSVIFTGGEATLRPELPELIAHAKELGMWVNLVTNGTRVDAGLAGRLAAAGLDSAQVSLEGVTAAVHEKVTMIPRSFGKTVAAVGYMRHAGVLVHTDTTINLDNLEECVGIPRFVRQELGLGKFSMNLSVPAGSAALNARLVVRYIELGPHLERIAEESKKHDVEFMWYSPTPRCMFNPIVHGLGNKGCSACDGLLSVGANGDVIPCASYDESVGNLLEQGAREIWQSRRARQYRDKFLAHPACRDCDNIKICNGACPLYWRQMGFGELEEQNGFAPVRNGYFEQ